MEITVLDPVVQRAYALAKSIAPGNISALIVGETGTGKERLAETIHQQSRRASKPFLRLNCAALSDTLLESELFGHERGAFTGAMQSKPGLLETADGGTVFLDELGEMPLPMQAKLLRVIEDGKVLRVGGLKAVPIDMRFISATNRSLEKEIERRAFRKDLYYRLNGVTLHLPPLRQRRVEIEPLARALLARAAREAGRERAPHISPDALEWLMSHPWPGNIRELRNAMERAVLVCQGDVVTRAELPPDVVSGIDDRSTPRAISDAELAAIAGGAASSSPSWGHETLDTCALDAEPPSDPDGADERSERTRVVDALNECVWNQTRAAELLGVSRGTLVARMTEYGLPRPRRRKS